MHTRMPHARLRLRRAAVGLALTSTMVVGLNQAAMSPAVAAPVVAPLALPAAPAPASARAWPVLHYGARGSAVVYLKSRLGLPARGSFGIRTLQAVKRLERNNGLLVNGIVGPSVWRRLGVPRSTTSNSRVGAPGSASWGRAVLAEARKHRGKPYSWGGSGPSAFDCSGFVGYAIRKATGKSLPRTSSAMYSATKRLTKSQLRAGDLVFVRKGGRVSHVAIYDGLGRWWEATRPGRPLGLNRPWTTSVAYGRVR